MNLSDTARVLTRVAAIDQRTIGKADVAAWHENIGHLELEDCLEAVRRFFATHADRRILPADIIAGVKVIRAERLQRTLEPPPPEPDDPHAYIAQLRQARSRIAAAPEGTPALEGTQSRGGPPPEDVRSALDEARSACMSASASLHSGDPAEGLSEAEQEARARAARERAGARRDDPARVSVRDLRDALPQREKGDQS